MLNSLFLLDLFLLIISVSSQIFTALIVLKLAITKKFEPIILYALFIFLICIVSPLTIYNLFIIKDSVEIGIRIVLACISGLIMIGVIRLNTGLNIYSEIIGDISSALKNLTRISVLLGILGFFSSFILGYIGYNVSFKTFCDNVFQTNLITARTINIIITKSGKKSFDNELIQEIQQSWNIIRASSLENDISIINNKGNIVLDTAKFSNIGLYVGNIGINNDLKNGPKNLKALIDSKQDWYGENINNSGHKQISTYVYNSNLNSLIAVNILKEKVEERVEENIVPWIMGFIFITIILLPMSLGLLQWAYNFSQRNIIKAQKELKESEEKFRQMAENIQQIFWIYDTKDKKLLYVSNSFEKIWELSVKHLYKNPFSFFKYIHSENRENIKQYLKKGVTTEVYEEYRIITSEKNIKWVSTRIFPIADKNGVIYRITGISEDITARKNAEEVINSSLEEKEILLKEIHHRVKNNLQVIYSILGLQANYIKDETYLNILRESQQRIKSMAIIHEKLYQSKDLAKINFQEYVTNLTNTLYETYRYSNQNLEIKINVEKIFLGIDSAIPCGLIINEIFSNSLKHAFSGINNGEITISFNQENDYFYLIIKDNGIGLPENFDIKKAKSLGLKLISTLIKQIKGHLELNGNNGTEFKISFPKRE